VCRSREIAAFLARVASARAYPPEGRWSEALIFWSPSPASLDRSSADHDHTQAQMEVTEQRRKMLEVIRDRGVGAASDFRLLVRRQDGA
jgi:hypothetical protein